MLAVSGADLHTVLTNRQKSHTTLLLHYYSIEGSVDYKKMEFANSVDKNPGYPNSVSESESRYVLYSLPSGAYNLIAKTSHYAVLK
jgi:hypothetical protein